MRCIEMCFILSFSYEEKSLSQAKCFILKKNPVFHIHPCIKPIFTALILTAIDPSSTTDFVVTKKMSTVIVDYSL